jgi:hypothetical protein
MNIALLTIHSADNYGATLQAYATQKKLEHLGHQVMIIDLDIPNPYSSLKGILLYPKHVKFERFRQKIYHQLTKHYSSLKELQEDPPVADCYLVGSDQTWNPEITRDKARAFFLDFGDENALRICYAPSFGMQHWEDNRWISTEDAKRLLHRFNMICVREAAGVRMLSETFGLDNVPQVIDPVLHFDDYSELIGDVPQNEELVLYKLTNSAEFYEKARKIANCLKLNARSIGSIRKLRGIKCDYPEGVEDWIRRIAGAKYVMTDSFHGMVFSILYRRQFVMYARTPKLTNRMASLLSLLGIEDRIIPGTSTADEIRKKLEEPIDYNPVHVRLEQLRLESTAYLNKIYDLQK